MCMCLHANKRQKIPQLCMRSESTNAVRNAQTTSKVKNKQTCSKKQKANMLLDLLTFYLHINRTAVAK